MVKLYIITCFKFIDNVNHFMSKMKKSKLTESIQTYITKPMKTRLSKKWRKVGYSSESDYLRDLVRLDLKS